jgi:hypothetical protein
MKPVEHDKVNVVFRHPGCSDLPAMKTVTDEGLPLVITCWQLSPAEIVDVMNSGMLWLSFIGESVPPILLSVRKSEQQGLN